MEMRKIRLKIESYGKAPVRYGKTTYKFSKDDTKVLIRNGWSMMGEGRSYDYLSFPGFHKVKEIAVTCEVPTHTEIEKLAMSMHRAGILAIEYVDICIAVYHPSSKMITTHFDVVRTGAPIGDPVVSQISPWFEIRCTSSWSVMLTWKDGGDKPPKWSDNKDAELLDVSDHVDEIYEGLFAVGANTTELITKYERNVSDHADEIDEGLFAEGASTIDLIKTYERNRKARNQCLAHYGRICQVCTVDLELVYGVSGRNIIHVHHLVPIAEIGSEYQVDPINDLVPVCPNCHYMLHQRTPPFTINELRSIIKKI